MRREVRPADGQITVADRFMPRTESGSKLRSWSMVGALVTAGATTALAKSGYFHTHLKGVEELPAVVTGAQGQATFKLLG